MAYLGLGAVELNGATQSEGFIPSECLQLVPDVGFQWLCGEPVHPDVLPLLASSKVGQPVVDVVDPERDVIGPDGSILQPGTGVPTGPEVVTEPPAHQEIRDAGFGIMGTLTAFLVGLAFTGA